MYMVGQQ